MQKSVGFNPVGRCGPCPAARRGTCRAGGTVRRISPSCLFGNSWCCRFRFRRCILVRSNVLPPREEGLLRIGRIFYRHFGSFSAGGVLLRVRWAFVLQAAGRIGRAGADTQRCAVMTAHRCIFPECRLFIAGRNWSRSTFLLRRRGIVLPHRSSLPIRYSVYRVRFRKHRSGSPLPRRAGG